MPVADPFKSLAVTTTNKTYATPAWEGPIPPSVVSWVQTAVDDNVRVTVPVPDGNYELAVQIRSAVQAEVRANYPGMSAYLRDQLAEDEETITAVAFTIGAARGRKAA